MKVLSVNVSLPHEVDYNGKKVMTGIFKKPIHDPVYVTKENLKGDGQADLKNHGGEHKAVYGYSSDHYPYWEKILDRKNLDFGSFGENLTISGLDESELCIGDQLRVGDSLLEISQPRVPCFKLGIALNNKLMPKYFINHFATGIYFRVIEEGFVINGDVVSIEHSNISSISVRRLFRAYFDKDFPEAEQLLRDSLSIDSLPDEWRRMIDLKL